LAKGGRKKVGEAYVELRADTTKLGPELEKLRAETAKTAKQVEGDTKKIGDGFGNVGEEIAKTTVNFRKFASAITSTLGIFTAIAASVAAVVAIVVKATRGFKTFGQSAKESIEGINKSLVSQRELFDSIESSSRQALSNIVAIKGSGLDEQIDEKIRSLGGGNGGQDRLEKGRARIASGANVPKAFRNRIEEIGVLQSRRAALNAAAQRRLLAIQDQEESPAAPRSTRDPLDSGGSLRSAPGGIEQNRELLDLLREIARNTRNQQQ